MKESIKSKGSFVIKQYRNDKLIKTVSIQNVIVNGGLALFSGLVSLDTAGSYTAFDYIACGTGTTAATTTDTTLEAEITDSGLARGTGTGTQTTTTVTNDTAKLVKSFTVTGSKTVTECGIFNAVSSGTMICRQTFTAINVETNDLLEFTWKVVFS